MFIITIKTESEEDVDAIKEVLEYAAAEGTIVESFGLQLDEE